MQHADYGEMVRVIKYFHDCDASHVESVAVTRVFTGQMAWDRVVAVFTLSGHPRATRAFAWNYQEDGKTKTAAVLEIPPVNSPQSAVAAVMVVKAWHSRRRDDNHDSSVTT